MGNFYCPVDTSFRCNFSHFWAYCRTFDARFFIFCGQAEIKQPPNHPIKTLHPFNFFYKKHITYLDKQIVCSENIVSPPTCRWSVEVLVSSQQHNPSSLEHLKSVPQPNLHSSTRGYPGSRHPKLLCFHQKSISIHHPLKQNGEFLSGG